MAVPPVLADLVSAPNAPTRSGRGGRDRRSKFYELSDNLQGAPIRGDAIILRPGARRMLLGDCERLGNAACARSLEPEPIIGKWLRISEGLPSGACWPALARLTPGGVGFCNRRGAAVWPVPARRLLRLLKVGSVFETAATRSLGKPWRDAQRECRERSGPAGWMIGTRHGSRAFCIRDGRTAPAACRVGSLRLLPGSNNPHPLGAGRTDVLD